MNIFIKYTKLMLTFSMMIFFFGCEEDTEQLPQVTAGFTFTASQETGTVTFLNTSDKATKYLWEFGDGKTSTEINPINTYAAGTYYVSLTASNDAGASDIFKDTLNIIVLDKIALPITFDNSNVDYSATAFNGASFAVADNPSLSGTNNKTTKVGAITNSGAAFEGIFFDLKTQIDLTTDKSIAMSFRATAPISVLLKLEEGTSGPIEATANHGGTGWETITFNFNSSAKYSRLTLFVDGPGTTAGTFYIDDIIQKQTEIPCVAETTQSITAADFNLTFKTDPGTAIGSFDAVYSYALNPNFNNNINKSCNVGKIVRSGSALFANNQIELSGKLDFTTHSGFKLKVYSGATGYNVLVKLE
ncbi:MAG: PKD domain-containing protein, partial [Cyclobacteriaceae bacterium]|nr:PKD domain-containing protein [Cyclobacteriaceae bacterium]